MILSTIFDDLSNPLVAPFAQWMATSKAFVTFVQSYERKIRKKVRTCQDLAETHDLYCELRSAYGLLQEPKFSVAYELLGKEAGRSADFSVTFRTHTQFQVEVTRLRLSQHEVQQGSAPLHTSKTPDALRHYEGRRLADVVCDKLGQFSPVMPNLLWVWGESRVLLDLDVGEIMLDLKRRAEQRDGDLYARHGFRKPADFIRAYQRLSAILIQRLPAPSPPPHLWQNNDAQAPLASAIAHRLGTLAAADTSKPFVSTPLENHPLP